MDRDLVVSSHKVNFGENGRTKNVVGVIVDMTDRVAVGIFIYILLLEQIISFIPSQTCKWDLSPYPPRNVFEIHWKKM
jgi:hypothetical protein